MWTGRNQQPERFKSNRLEDWFAHFVRSGRNLEFVFFEYFLFFFSSYLSDNVNVVTKP
jgi:hypothetical protein